MSDFNDLLNTIKKTAAFDAEIEKANKTANQPEVTLKRDDKGILWSYDTKTGKKIGRVFEHGDS